MARVGLRHELAVSLQRVVATREIVHAPRVSVKTNGHFTQVELSVCPVISSTLTGVNEAADPADVSLYLIILQQATESSTAVSSAAFSGEAAQVPEASSETEAVIAALRKELHAQDEYLQCTQEELESSTEELKSSNEEMQSVNEELQSTNEELETSREEMQSINEELSTVNTELQEGAGSDSFQQRYEQPDIRYGHCHDLCRSAVAHTSIYANGRSVDQSDSQ